MTPKRQMCAQCARPLTTCYCQLIETKTNAWPVCLIQHVKEATHAKGTARIAQLSLNNIKTIQLADRDPFVPPEKAHDYWQRPALIYPNIENNDVVELRGTEPRPLIFLDGTWRKSKAMLLNSPYLQSLPRYSFSQSVRLGTGLESVVTRLSLNARIHCVGLGDPRRSGE